MIDYQTYCQIHHLLTEKKLGLRQIARELNLGLNTVRKWAQRQSFQRAAIPKRPSKLDSFKGDVVRLLEQHPYSAQQIFQQLKERGYKGSYTILKGFVRQVRPKPRPTFLTLHFEPGECAQVDWGYAGSVRLLHRLLSAVRQGRQQLFDAVPIHRRVKVRLVVAGNGAHEPVSNGFCCVPGDAASISSGPQCKRSQRPGFLL